jgi:hypothetical protein
MIFGKKVHDLYSCLNYLSCEFPTAIQTTILENFLCFSILCFLYAFLFYSYVFFYSCVLDSCVPKEPSVDFIKDTQAVGPLSIEKAYAFQKVMMMHTRHSISY